MTHGNPRDVITEGSLRGRSGLWGSRSGHGALRGLRGHPRGLDETRGSGGGLGVCGALGVVRVPRNPGEPRAPLAHPQVPPAPLRPRR